jgi:hypothetical protein
MYRQRLEVVQEFTYLGAQLETQENLGDRKKL